MRALASASRSRLLVTSPVTKLGRLQALADGIAAMSTEEAYYWYAKCMGRDGNRHAGRYASC